MSATPAAVIVLAAGDGTRMRSQTSKMLHKIAGRTLVAHAVHAAAGTHAPYIAVTVRAHRDAVAAEVLATFPEAVIADQDDIPGTGRAAECGLAALPADLSGTVIVTYGDTPLLSAETLVSLTQQHEATANAITVLTTHLPDPSGYGRILRDADGSVTGIIEDKDARAQQADGGPLAHAVEIDEINSGIYAFSVDVLRELLPQVGTDNNQREKYLTDVLALAKGRGGLVEALVIDDTPQILGVNDKSQLAQLGKELNERLVKKLMVEQGAIVIDPATTWVDAEVTVGADTVIHPGCQLLGATSIGVECTIGPDTTLKDTEVDDGASVVRTHAELAVIGPQATVGPFSYLRPGTTLGARGKIGGFVETKNAQIGDDAKVPHLTYCGDATIGEGANIGAGTIFANYDGVTKNHTNVGRYSFVGSNSVIVAPGSIGDGTYVAAGSAVTAPVAPGELAVTRARQRNVEGWVARRRAGTATDAAAQAAVGQGLAAAHQGLEESRQSASAATEENA